MRTGLKVTLENLEEIMSIILKLLNDSHPRVRLAAINVVGQLFVSFHIFRHFRLFGLIQYNEIVLITLFEVMNDFQNPELQRDQESMSFYRDLNQVYKVQSLFSQGKMSRFNSLSLALPRFFFSGLPDIRSQAALHLGELFTQFSFAEKATLDSIRFVLLSAFENILVNQMVIIFSKPSSTCTPPGIGRNYCSSCSSV
ncbi:hypothetical protein REPUB_Repub16aG0139000 [Reevesia pubescens]